LFARGPDELETLPFVFEEPSPPCPVKGAADEVKNELNMKLEIEVSCLYFFFHPYTMHTNNMVFCNVMHT